MALGRHRNPLLRVLFLAGHLDSRIKAMVTFKSLRLAAKQLRTGLEVENSDFGDQFRQWIEKTDVVLDWVLSDSFLRAPMAWPEQVREVFLVPVSPYEMTCLLERQVDGLERGILQCYCHGMSMDLLEELLQFPESQIIDLMKKGVEDYRLDPRFALWELNLNWGKVILPREMSEGMLGRLEISRELAISPLDVKTDSARLLVQSPRFMAYALRVAPKRVGVRPRGLFSRTGYSVRPPRELDGQEE